jgi:4,5-DOPA dioxygenase extradiol
MTRLTPAIFFGHGNPMNAIGQNAYTDGWSYIGHTMPRPKAILSISAHWYVPETGVTITTAPRTNHGFGTETAGFPINGVDGGSISMLTVKIG